MHFAISMRMTYADFCFGSKRFGILCGDITDFDRMFAFGQRLFVISLVIDGKRDVGNGNFLFGVIGITDRDFKFVYVKRVPRF